ncbi:MAG TPA: hypothetical protein VK968_08235, partial [Roseimicrobium sp.]|nr:hypothetical protein [Roseimicrobium sp.]
MDEPVRKKCLGLMNLTQAGCHGSLSAENVTHLDFNLGDSISFWFSPVPITNNADIPDCAATIRSPDSGPATLRAV